MWKSADTRRCRLASQPRDRSDWEYCKPRIVRFLGKYTSLNLPLIENAGSTGPRPGLGRGPQRTWRRNFQNLLKRFPRGDRRPEINAQRFAKASITVAAASDSIYVYPVQSARPGSLPASIKTRIANRVFAKITASNTTFAENLGR